MQLRNVFTDEDAVSPVIGVILMVAITVIMAAVTGAFVLGIQSDVSVSPTTSWDTSSADTNSSSGGLDLVEFRHRAGDGLDNETLRVRMPGAQAQGVRGDGQVRVGDVIRVKLDETAPTQPAGNEILLIWSESGSSDSVILVEHRFLNDYHSEFDDVYVN